MTAPEPASQTAGSSAVTAASDQKGTAYRSGGGREMAAGLRRTACASAAARRLAISDKSRRT